MPENIERKKLLEQQEIERKYTIQGIQKYLDNSKNLQEKSAGNTDFACILYQKYVPELSADFSKLVESKRNFSHYLKLLDNLQPELVIYTTLFTMLGAYGGATVASIATNIGRALESEHLVNSFVDDKKLYINKIKKDMKQRRVKSVKHKQNVIKHSAHKQDVYEDWSLQEVARVGLFLIKFIVKKTGLFIIKGERKGKKSQNFLNYSPELLEWIKSVNAQLSTFNIIKPPCIIPPRDWTDYNRGGYYTEQQYLRTPMILGKNNHREVYKNHFKYIPDVVSSINALQKTAWKVNKFMLTTLINCWEIGVDCLPSKNPVEVPKFDMWEGNIKDAPENIQQEFTKWKGNARRIYTEEATRFGKALSISNTIKIANDFAEYPEIFFVYVCDFRGRVYPTSSPFSPQGADYSKSLLEFANGEPIGIEGFKWLKIHLANCFGIDKVSYAERIKWVDDNKDHILAFAQNPINDLSWTDADKPFQFIRACREFYLVNKHGLDYKSTLPIGVDGSCNGLQHFSALLRDITAGKSTNLLPSEKPSDIYQSVADVLIQNLNKENSEQANYILSKGITRKITKKPVMTLPYGATQRTCFQSILEHIEENNWKCDTIKVAQYLSPILWRSITEVLKSSVEAMDWLKEFTRELVRHNIPIQWLSPTNFLCIQDKKKQKTIKIDTSLFGKLSIKLKQDIDQLDMLKNTNGISPNFIHSIDASHLILTIKELRKQGVQDFCVVHDDYGTHACHIPKLQEAIRNTFVDIHKRDHLQDLIDIFTSLYPDVKFDFPELPKKGSLDLELVKKSEYFFC